MARMLSRRSLITLAATGAAGVILGRKFFGGPDEHLLEKGATTVDMLAAGGGGGAAAPQVVNASTLSQSLHALGNYIYLTPEKLGGGTHAVDLATGKTLAWISYWNYGDTCPISHHLAAYPSSDPYKGFEFVNSTQGGDNVMIYGLPTQIKSRGILDRYGQGNHIYRVQYDGQSMNLVEDISESTGMGLGVHTVIYPDATGFVAADGQKDVAAFFNRPDIGNKTEVQMAYRADWIGKNSAGGLEANWTDGGKLRIVRLTKAKETDKFHLEGTKGNKIDWEMVPMAEYLVYTGQLPGDSPRTLSGLDAVVHHPDNRYSALIIRMCSAAVIIDRQNWEPICCLHNPEGSPGNLPVKKVSSDPDTWEIEFADIKCVGHEAGFSPDGKHFTMMNNIKQNNMAVYDTSAADPRDWKKITYVKDPSWVGDYPSPFHLCFSMDGSKMFVSVLYPKPASSGSCVVDTKNWMIIKKFQNIGPDCQTMAVTYDGKYVLQIFSGFQRLSSGLFIYTQDTLEPVGYLPNFGGHHDCVVVPTKVEHLRNSRCTTL
jgi:thiocyanate desulfurase